MFMQWRFKLDVLVTKAVLVVDVSTVDQIFNSLRLSLQRSFKGRN